MMNRPTTQRIAAAAAGLAVATVGGLATSAAAADDPGVDLSVTIEDNTPGALSLSVAPNDGVVLAEEGSGAEARQFLGTLPTPATPRTSRRARTGRSSARRASSPPRDRPRSAPSTSAGPRAC
jgi:hypothetical protein